MCPFKCLRSRNVAIIRLRRDTMGRRSVVGPLDAFFKLCPGPAVPSQKQLASQPGDAPLKPTKRHRTKAPLEGWTASPSTKRPIATPQQSSPRPARPNPAKRVRGSGDSSSANRAAAARQADPVVVDHDSEGPPGLSDTDTDEEHDLAMLAKAAKPATRVARRATSGSTATSPSSANGAAPASSGPGGRPVVRSMNGLWHFADSNLSQTDDPCASAWPNRGRDQELHLHQYSVFRGMCRNRSDEHD